ncbi:hypothetical protein B9Z19DRAFT_104016 [Tuber borchii]|uniref:Uncharacterized protein n=1 Tax=Tuber borchii TaxID=42251 RepID=A0A2T6ZRI6_TUBBO|nr:hypothetical protein B9Z19DRAFT_104016 [Tuber borchii]
MGFQTPITEVDRPNTIFHFCTFLVLFPLSQPVLPSCKHRRRKRPHGSQGAGDPRGGLKSKKNGMGEKGREGRGGEREGKEIGGDQWTKRAGKEKLKNSDTTGFNTGAVNNTGTGTSMVLSTNQEGSLLHGDKLLMRLPYSFSNKFPTRIECHNYVPISPFKQISPSANISKWQRTHFLLKYREMGETQVKIKTLVAAGDRVKCALTKERPWIPPDLSSQQLT